MGFNASIDSLISRDEKSFHKIFPNKKRNIFNYIHKKLYFKKIDNSELFLFRVINCSIFLERFA